MRLIDDEVVDAGVLEADPRAWRGCEGFLVAFLGLLHLLLDALDGEPALRFYLQTRRAAGQSHVACTSAQDR